MMKKLSLFLGMAVVASLSLTNCTEKESLREHSSVSEGIPFEISTELDVKTVNDGLATKWAENDSLNLFHAVAGETSYVSDGKFTLDATREGVFTGELASALDNEQSYDWYAIYPYEKYVKTPTATNSGYRNLGQISNGKYLTQNGNDSKAHLCGAALPLYGVAKSVASDAMPQMQMKNLTSVVAVDVNNTTTEALNVNSIKFTSTEDIVGTYYIDFTGESVKYTMSDAKYVKSTASLTVENSEIAAGAKATFYIPIKPHTAKAGSTLTLSVNGYEKESPSLTKDVTFTAGKIKTLKFDYNSSSVTTEYKSLAELSAAILDGKTEFTLNLTDPAVVTRVCSDNKTIYLQDKTGGMMFFGSNLIPDAKAGTTISGKITGTAELFNGLPEVTVVDLSGATTGETTEIPYTELTIAELNADFNKYLNMQVKLSGVEVSAAFSNDDRNGEVKQGENTLAIYVKNTKEDFSFTNGQLGDIVVFPAIYNTKKQVYFWAASDFAITGAADVTSVINLGSAFSVNVGKTVSLNASTNSTATIKYSSEDETIATVSAEGVVTGVNEGTVKITASVDAVKGFTAATATTTITVNPAGTISEDKYFVKVTEAPTDWSGTYLIVCEDQKAAFDGSLEKLDAVNNYKEVEVAGGKILATDDLKKITFVINGTNKSLKAASGMYVGYTAAKNGLNTSDEVIENKFDLDKEGNALISSGTAPSYLKFNKSSDQMRFRYFKTGQTAIQLYKLED